MQSRSARTGSFAFAWKNGCVIALPMFPLESVLLPGMVLPLQVFEERYRTLVADCLAGDKQFGVVLIERGSEVGGGDVRTSVGTVAEIVKAEQVPDGRWAVVAVGTTRVRVTQWLDDGPYPRAEVEEWPDELAEDPEALAATYTRTVADLRRILALSAELGDGGHPLAEITDQADLGSYQLALLAPIGPLDRQTLLSEAGPAPRLDRLASMLAEEEQVLQARLNGG